MPQLFKLKAATEFTVFQGVSVESFLTEFTVFQGVAVESFLDSFKFCH